MFCFEFLRPRILQKCENDLSGICAFCLNTHFQYLHESSQVFDHESVEADQSSHYVAHANTILYMAQSSSYSIFVGFM